MALLNLLRKIYYSFPYGKSLNAVRGNAVLSEKYGFEKGERGKKSCNIQNRI